VADDRSLLDEVIDAVPRLVDRTVAQVDLVRRLAAHLPCVGGLLAARPPVPDDAHEAVPAVDVLQVAALQDSETESAGGGAAVAADPDVAVDHEDGDHDGAPVPTEDDLPVQDYDSLAASQVVPRLATLSDDELAAVGAYERAHRNRQTILNKVKQLQSR
jgi:hypothetical protein